MHALYYCFCVTFSSYVSGLADLKRQLEANYDSCPINTLCTADGSSRFIYHCFQPAKPLEPIRMPFDFMQRLHQNDLFHRVWSNATRKAARRRDDLTIQDIVDEIWRPAFKECEGTILGGMRDGSIKLQAVDSYFRCYTNIEAIEGHLHRLYNGVELCYGRAPSQTCPPWIHIAVHRVYEYWTLSDYAAAAKKILELKDKLKLTGDFQAVATIAEKVKMIPCMFVAVSCLNLSHNTQVSTSMQDQSLEAVSDSLLDAGDFLKNIQNDKGRCDFLYDFASSLEIVEWLRKETRGTIFDQWYFEVL